jgi:glycosyltransferase involved in cell wall biosynthesis
MKLGYVTSYDSGDIGKFSGLGYYICQALAAQDLDITRIDGLKEKYHYLVALKDRFYSRFSSRGYFREREIFVARDYARQILTKLSDVKVDVIFSPGTIPIAYLDTDKPIAFWGDSNFGGMHNFYPDFTNLCRETIVNGNKIEQEALNRCELAIYSSDWAAETAIDNYRLDPNKVKVVPFGANLQCSRDTNEVEQIISRRLPNKCKLLFVGIDWHRKGGDIALDVAAELNRMGLETELAIIGCQPDVSRPLPDYVKPYGFISKNNHNGVKRLNKHFSESHFFIMPSRFEAYGVVFCEANSFGVPCLGTDVGGIPTIIRNDVNGKLFSLDAATEDYCSFILDYFSDFSKYKRLALSSFKEYQTRLNWSAAGSTVKKLLNSLF